MPACLGGLYTPDEEDDTHLLGMTAEVLVLTLQECAFEHRWVHTSDVPSPQDMEETVECAALTPDERVLEHIMKQALTVHTPQDKDGSGFFFFFFWWLSTPNT